MAGEINGEGERGERFDIVQRQDAGTAREGSQGAEDGAEGEQEVAE